MKTLPAIFTRKTAFVTLLAIVSIGFALLFMLMWPYHDDLWFYGSLCRYSGGDGWQCGPHLWHGYVETIREHFLYDNFRLSNIVATALLPAPRWIAMSLTSAAMIVAVIAMCKICGVGSRHLLRATVLLCALTFYPPWSDQMFSMIFSYNYTWGTMWFSLGLYLFKANRLPGIIGTMALGIVTGWWHEGFAVPLLCGLCILLVYPGRRDFRHFSYLVGLAAGLYLVTLSPLFFNQSTGYAANFMQRLSLSTAIRHFLLFVEITAIFIMIARGHLRRLLRDELAVCLTVVSIAAYGIGIIGGTLRSGFAGFIAEGMLGVVLLGYVHMHLQRTLRVTLLATAWIFMTAHFAAAAYHMARTTGMVHEIISDYTSGKTDKAGAIFAPIQYEWEMPWYVAGKVSTKVFYDKCTRSDINAMQPHGAFYIIPADLKDYTAGLGRIVDVSSGLRIYRNRLVAPLDSIQFHDVSVGRVTRTDGKYTFTHSEDLYMEKFVGADGRTYALINYRPHLSHILLPDIKHIEYNPDNTYIDYDFK